MARGFGAGLLHGTLLGVFALAAASLILPPPVPDLAPPQGAPQADAPVLRGAGRTHDGDPAPLAPDAPQPIGARNVAPLQPPAAASEPAPRPAAEVGDQPLPATTVPTAQVQAVETAAPALPAQGGDRAAAAERPGGLPMPDADHVPDPGEAPALPAAQPAMPEDLPPFPSVAPALSPTAPAPDDDETDGEGTAPSLAPNLFLPPDIGRLGLTSRN